jgi:hypothetical protein
VDDGVEGLQCVVVGEDHVGQRLAIQGAVRGHDRGPEPLDDGGEDGRARRLHVPHDGVGVDHQRPSGREEGGHRRLAAADAAGEADQDHGSSP